LGEVFRLIPAEGNTIVAFDQLQLKIPQITKNQKSSKKIPKKFPKFFFHPIKIVLFPVVSKSVSYPPAKFQLNQVKTMKSCRRYKNAHTQLALPEVMPQKLQIPLFVQSKKFLFPILSGGKDITPA